MVAGAPSQLPPFDICTLGYTSTFNSTQLIQFQGNTIDWAGFINNLQAGTLYVNIHTADAPAGERLGMGAGVCNIHMFLQAADAAQPINLASYKSSEPMTGLAQVLLVLWPL